MPVHRVPRCLAESEVPKLLVGERLIQVVPDGEDLLIFTEKTARWLPALETRPADAVDADWEAKRETR